MEICNYFGVNPYQIMSSGSMMIAADDGHELVRKLEQAGIHAVVVGRTNSGNDRILRNGEMSVIWINRSRMSYTK